MKLQFISDGTPAGTAIFDPRTREKLDDVVGYSLESDPQGGPDQFLTVVVRIAGAGAADAPAPEPWAGSGDPDEVIVKRDERWYCRDGAKLVPPGGLKSREAAEIHAESLGLEVPDA